MQLKILESFLSPDPSIDFSEMFLKWDSYKKINDKSERKEWEESRIKDAPPSMELSSYCGRYNCEMYGNAFIELEKDKLVLKFEPSPIFIGDLSHWHNDVFEIKLRDLPSLPSGTVNFILDKSGKIEQMKVDIPNPDFYFDELHFYKKD